MKPVAVLGVMLTGQGYDEAIDRFLVLASGTTPARAHFVTVHTVVEASADPRLLDVLNSADMRAMDGVPLVWIARMRGATGVQRVCGPDVMLTICDRGREAGLRHYFLGGAAGVPEVLAERLSARFPGLNVVGMESPPFRPLSADEDRALIDRIDAARPHVLWVGLGSPKQEFWAAEHQPSLLVPLILPVGAAFDFHSGRTRRAPGWMQRLGVEWLFRLASEPRRLWRRYLVTNCRFVYLVLREQVRRVRAP